MANFLYDGDAPLAERRAQALTIDQEQLRELLGEADLRELLDADAIAEVEEAAQCLAEPHRARSADGIHDLCLRLGDLTREDLGRRVASPELLQHVDRLVRSRRLLELRIAGERRLIAAEDAARYRDGLGIPLPPGLPTALLEPVAHPVLELVRRYARTHGPFTLREPAERFALDAAAVENALRQLAHEGRVLEGRLPSRRTPPRVVRRGDSAPDSPQIPGPAAPRSRAGRAAHAGPLSHPLAGAARAAPRARISMRCSTPSRACRARRCPHRWLKVRILPARIADYAPAGLDTLIAAGEVAWAGVEPIGERDGRIALFLADKLPLLPQRGPSSTRSPSAKRSCWPCSNPPAPASSIRCIRPSAAAIPARRSMRCGAWSGAASSPTTRCTPCAPTSQRPESARTPRRAANRRGLPFPPHHAAHRAGPLVAAAGARAIGKGITAYLRG